MSVYVDGARNGYGRMKMCHMIADSLVELLIMADKIGVDRKWFQPYPKASFPHFDIAQSKRALAIEAGAIEVTMRELSAHMKRLRPAFGIRPRQSYVESLEDDEGLENSRDSAARHYSQSAKSGEPQ